MTGSARRLSSRCGSEPSRKSAPPPLPLSDTLNSAPSAFRWMPACSGNVCRLCSSASSPSASRGRASGSSAIFHSVPVSSATVSACDTPFSSASASSGKSSATRSAQKASGEKRMSRTTLGGQRGEEDAAGSHNSLVLLLRLQETAEGGETAGTAQRGETGVVGYL